MLHVRVQWYLPGKRITSGISAMSIEKRDTEFALKLPNLTTERGLRNIQESRST